MKTLQFSILFLCLGLLPSPNYAADNSYFVSRQAQLTLTQLEHWDNQVLKAYLQYRISENQHLIDFINKSGLDTVKSENDASYDVYVASLLKDQQTLSRLSKGLQHFSKSQKLDFDAMLNSWPLFHMSLKQDLNRELNNEQGKRLLNRVLYFSLQDKYAQR